MTSWRDGASEQAQQDLDELFGVALGFAQHQLAKHGEFYPYAALLRSHGRTELLPAMPDTTDPFPASSDVIESCLAALKAKRAEIRAGAVVADVHTPDIDSDAIEISLEHVEGQALRVLLPYSKKRFRKSVDYGPMQAMVGKQRIWNPS